MSQKNKEIKEEHCSTNAVCKGLADFLSYGGGYVDQKTKTLEFVIKDFLLEGLQISLTVSYCPFCGENISKYVTDACTKIVKKEGKNVRKRKRS